MPLSHSVFYSLGQTVDLSAFVFKTIRRAPVKIGNVNKSIPPVMKRAQGNNGIVFNVR